MTLTRDDVEAVLDYMEEANLMRLARPTGNWHQIYCPFHSDGNEKKPSCGCCLVEENRNGKFYPVGNFHCFSCGAAYSFSDGIKEILKMHSSSIEAHPFLQKYVDNISQEDLHSLVPKELMSSLYSKFAAESLKMRVKGQQQFISENELASYRYTVPYMYQRKLTDDVIVKYDVGFDGNHIPPGRKKPLPCVTFPVRDIQGRTLFICRRSIEGKYFNLPQNIEKSVYGIYELPKNTKEIIICESVFNALTSVVYGRPAVALLGTGTEYQIEQLKRLGVPSFVICLDNDEAGRRGTAKLKKALSKSKIVWTMTVPEGKDVNQLSKEEFEQCYAMRE